MSLRSQKKKKKVHPDTHPLRGDVTSSGLEAQTKTRASQETGSNRCFRKDRHGGGEREGGSVPIALERPLE